MSEPVEIGINQEFIRQNTVIRAWAGKTNTWNTDVNAELPEKCLFYGIPFRLRLRVTKKKNPVQLAVAVPNGANPNVKVVPVEVPRGLVERDRQETGLAYTSFVEFKLTVQDPKVEFVHFVLKYGQHKAASAVDCSVRLCLQNPFKVDLQTKRVGTVGFLCQTRLQNSLAVPVNRLVLTFDMPSYLVSPSDSSETEPVDVLPPGKEVSKVFQMEFASKHVPECQQESIPVSIRWCDSREKEFLLHPAFAHVIELHEDGTGEGFPLLIEMIGSPQSHRVMEPFQVKIAIHNSSAKRVQFTVDVKADTERGVVPYGNHFFKSTLESGESPRFDFWFVGLKQGLLLYPEFVLEIVDGPNTSVNLNCGVLIC